MALRALPMHRVGQRAHLFLGGDRELVMFAGLAAAALVFAAQTWVATGFGLALWTLVLGAARRMAAADPWLRHVYLRHRRYRRYYPARSTPWRVNSPAQARQYR